MELGYQAPLYILPFDQRSSFIRDLFGFTPPLSANQTETVSASKQVIYDGLKLALARGAPKATAGILVDEQFGAAILRDAHEHKVVTCAPVEKSGQEEFNFEYGDHWREHIAAVAPTFVKVLVRYNPEGDEAMNRCQAARLKQLSDYCHQSGHRFMFELLVPMTREQSDRLRGDRQAFDRDMRPRLVVETIKELQDAGVEPDVWKIEGLDRRSDCERVAQAARRDGRDGVGCIILGRGANKASVLAWLRTAAPVPGFIGFAVGRTSFWDALVGLRDRTFGREAAVRQVANRYLEWVHAFADARDGGFHPSYHEATVP